MEIKTHVLTRPQPGLRADSERQKDARENIDAAKKPSNTSTANLAGFDENDEIVDTGIAKANLVHDGNYVHTDNNYTDEEKNAVEANTAARHTHSNKSILDATTASFTTEDETKLDNIEAGAQVNVIETVRVDGTALDISNKSVNIDLSGKADKVSHGVEGNFAALGNDGNLVDSGIKPNSDPSSNEFSTDVPTGGAVLSIVNDLDADIVSNDGTNVQVHIVETDGKITRVSIDRDNTAPRNHVHGNISTDGKIGQASGLAVVTGSNGMLETADLATNSPDASGTALEFITSISQESTGKITPAKAAIPSATTEAPGVVQLTTNLDPNTAPVDKPATAHAVSNAISSINNVLASMHEDDHLADGKYITSLSQTNGDVSYEVANMDSSPSAGSKKPVTSEGIYDSINAEKNERVHFDTWIAERVPSAASGQNQLADKAYVDDLGERLEARYLAYSASNLPFPTYEIFDQTKASGEFWYDGQIVAPNNNDVIVITADESKTDMSTTGNPPTTRYRYIAHKVQSMNGDTPVVDTDGHPVWEFDDQGNIIWSGDWYFEYIINNSALNQDQLLAINSGITASKVYNYDKHLTDYNNPHHTTYEQVAAASDIETTAGEIGILHGAVITTDELNSLDDIDTNKTVQAQINEKADRVLPANLEDPNYHPQGNIVIVGDIADVNGRYNIEDSGAAITQYYDGTDTVNPATGSAIKQAIDNLDAEVTSDTGRNVNVTVVQENGFVTGVIMLDHSASASQGALADSAIQKVKVTDIQNGTRVTRELPKSVSDGNAVTIDLTDYKHLQTAVSDPTASGTTLDFISNVSQNAEGVITASKKSVTVDSNYDPQSGNPASGAAIADALGGLGGESTGVGNLVNVTVNTAGGEVNSVTVDDSKVVERAADVLNSAIDAIDNKIQSLDVSNILQDGKYITSLSETDGKIQVETDNMDTVPTTGSQKPVISGGVKTAIDDKIAGLHGSTTGEGDWVNVTVTTEGGEVTSVSVDDGGIVTATEEAIQQAIDGLDVGNTLSPGTYITSLSEADGKIQVSTENMDTVPTTGSQKPVTSGGVKSAIESAVESLDYTDTPVAHQFVTGVNETDGVISVNRAQPVISDVSGLEAALNTKADKADVELALDTKADKVDGATEGNLVTFDATGNIADTGLNANTFATAEQGDKADTAVQSVKMVDGNGVELNNDTSVIIPLAAPTGSGETPGLMSAGDKAKLDGLDGNLNGKADKVDGAVVGDLASLDSQGNLVDSGINLMDVITGVSIMLDDGGISTKQSLVSGHEAILEETTDAEVSRILAALH